MNTADKKKTNKAREDAVRTCVIGASYSRNFKVASQPVFFKCRVFFFSSSPSIMIRAAFFGIAVSGKNSAAIQGYMRGKLVGITFNCLRFANK